MTLNGAEEIWRKTYEVVTVFKNSSISVIAGKKILNFQENTYGNRFPVTTETRYYTIIVKCKLGKLSQITQKIHIYIGLALSSLFFTWHMLLNQRLVYTVTMLAFMEVTRINRFD